MQNVENHILNLSNTTVGNLYHLNHPQAMPSSINFTQHLTVPLGFVISVELHGVQFGEVECDDRTSVEVRNQCHIVILKTTCIRFVGKCHVIEAL